MEAYIWQYLESKIGNEYGTAGMMGNLQAESNLRTNNLQNSYENGLGYTDESYTTAVDNGTYSEESFVNDEAGYGLAQWTFYSRKQMLYDRMLERGVSISNIDLQLDFLWWELQNTYPTVLATLTNATTILEASNAVLFDFENPADQSESVQAYRESLCQAWYATFADGNEPEEPEEPTNDNILHVEADAMNNVIYCSEPDIATFIGTIPNGEYKLLSTETITNGEYEFYEIEFLGGVFYVVSFPPYTYVTIKINLYSIISQTPYKLGQLTADNVNLLQTLSVLDMIKLKFTFNHNKRQIGTNCYGKRLTFDNNPYIILGVEKNGFLKVARSQTTTFYYFINPKYVRGVEET